MKSLIVILFMVVVSFSVAYLEGNFLVALDKQYQAQLKNKSELLQKNLELEMRVFTLKREIEELKKIESEESQMLARTRLGWLKDSEMLYHLDQTLLLTTDP